MKHRVVLVVGGVLGGWMLGVVCAQVWFLNRDHSVSVGLRDALTMEESDGVADAHSGLIRLDADQIREFGIEMGVVGPATLHADLCLPGRIVLNADRVAAVVPRVAGVTTRIAKTLGDAVIQDEVMAVIESRELADATADYLISRQQVMLKRNAFDREARLWEQKISAEQDYLDAQQALAQAVVAHSSASQKLYALGRTEQALAELPDQPRATYTRYEVRAPFAGTVIERQAGLGEPVTDTSALFRIADLSTVWVELGVHEEDLGAVHVGQTLVIEAMGTASNARASVDTISPLVSPSTRMATVRAAIDNRSGDWRPGRFVTGRIRDEGRTVELAVPHTALQPLAGEAVVFVDTGQGFRARAVATGREDATYVEILSGLTPGQCYVKANAFTLKAELSKGSFADDDD